MLKFDESKAGKDAPESFKLFSFSITSDYPESDSPHRNVPQAILEQMHELHMQSLKGNVQIIKKLERLIERYPRVPALYNYLSMAYKAHGNSVKFNKLNDLLIKQFPDYPVSRINKATDHIIKREFDAAQAVLGHDMTLNAFLPNRQIYHVSEVVQFYETVVRFFIRKHEFDVADSHLKMLKEVSEKFNNINKERIQQLETEKADEIEAIKDAIFDKYDVQAVQKKWVEARTEAPVFTHPEINWLYENDLGISQDKIEQLLALPRPTLIQDLEKVLDDAMARLDYFEGTDWAENTHNFSLHALFLLAELRATESLVPALNIIRQDDEWAYFWYSDALTEILPILFYKMLGDDLSILKPYLLEPNNDYAQRGVVTSAVAILAHHHPEKRQACIDFLEDILTDFYDNRGQYEDIIDIDLNESIVSDLMNLKSRDSWPLIEKLYKSSLISDEICGNLAEIEAELLSEEKPPFYFNTIPNIFETYAKIKAWNEPASEEEHKALLARIEEHKQEIKEKECEIKETKAQIAQLLGKPQANTPKVGRNDACPCGSGKKYKKCHGA